MKKLNLVLALLTLLPFFGCASMGFIFRGPAYGPLLGIKYVGPEMAKSWNEGMRALSKSLDDEYVETGRWCSPDPPSPELQKLRREYGAYLRSWDRFQNNYRDMAGHHAKRLRARRGEFIELDDWRKGVRPPHWREDAHIWMGTGRSGISAHWGRRR
ncbi:MAG: hypothetical protein JW838_00820 [Spirochaetes bacterium]|nr:hypothetical protein [Spirochaetota bacterium]